MWNTRYRRLGAGSLSLKKHVEEEGVASLPLFLRKIKRLMIAMSFICGKSHRLEVCAFSFLAGYLRRGYFLKGPCMGSAAARVLYW